MVGPFPPTYCIILSKTLDSSGSGFLICKTGIVIPTSMRLLEDEMI